VCWRFQPATDHRHPVLLPSPECPCH
jgi:hypothetical protein